MHKKSLQLSALSNWASLLINIVIGFLLTPFIIKHIGKTGFGYWTFISSFVGYYGLLNLGVQSAVSRYIAFYIGRKDENSLNKVASTAIVMFTFTACIAIFISFVFATKIALYFNVRPEDVPAFKNAVRLLGLSTGITFPSAVLISILVAHEEFIFRNIANITSAIFRAVMIVILLSSGYALNGIAFAVFLTASLEFTINFILCKHLTSEIKFKLQFVNTEILMLLIKFGGFTFILSIVNMMRISLDSIIIGKWIGMTAVGIYAIGAKLIDYMNLTINTTMGVLTPRFAQLHGENNMKKIHSLFQQALFISTFLTCLCGLLLFLFGNRLITLWVGETFKEAIPVLWILLLGYILGLIQVPGIGLISSLNKHGKFALLNLIEASVNVALSIMLVSKYGMLGIAWGTSLSMILGKLFIQPIYIIKISGMSIFSYIKPMTIPLLTASLIAISFYFIGVPGMAYKFTVFEFLLYPSLTALLYSALVFFGVINKDYFPFKNKLKIPIFKYNKGYEEI